MKKLLSMLLAFTMVLSMFGTAVFAEGEIVDEPVVGEEEVVESDNLIYGLVPSDEDSDYPTSFSWQAQKDPAVLTDGVINTDADSYKANYSFNQENRAVYFAYLCEGISFKEVNVASHQPTDLKVRGLKSVKVEVLIDGEWVAAGTADNLPANAASTVYALTSDETIVADGVRVSFTINTAGSGNNTAAISEIQVFADVKSENPVGTLKVNTAKMETPAIVAKTDVEVTAAVNAPVTFEIDATVTDGGALTYQWYKDGVAINSRVDKLLTLFKVTAEDAGTYKVVVTNTGANNPAKAEAEFTLAVEGEVTNLAEGKTYEWLSAPHASYPDTNNTEMTDGHLPYYADFGQAGFVGAGNSNTLSLTIDLGELCTVDSVAAILMSTANSGILMPTEVKAEYSANGAIFADFGTWTYDNRNAKGFLTAEIVPEAPVVARYITVTVPGTNYMQFMGETMVFGTTGGEAGEVERTGNLIKGARFVTNVPDQNFIYGNGPLANAGMTAQLTDGEYVRDTQYVKGNGIVGFNTTGYLEFNAGENIEFRQFVVHTATKQSFANDYPDYQDVVIEVYKDGVWYKLNDPADLPYESQKTYYFASEEPITGSKFRFNVVGRNGLYVMAFTEMEVFAEAYEGEADVVLSMPASTANPVAVEIANGDEATIRANEFITFNANVALEGDAVEGNAVTYQWFKNGATIKDATHPIYTVKGVAGENATYKVEVYSKSADGYAYAVSSDEIAVKVEGEAYNYAAGLAYEYENYETNVVASNSKYADTDMKELTDGIVTSAVSYGDAGYVGFGAYKTMYLTFDLGEYGAKVDKFQAVFMSTNNSGIKLPASLRISVRNSEEESWKDVGTWTVPNQNVSGIQVATIALEEAIRNRYVRFYSYNGGMAFVSEMMIFGEAPVADTPVLKAEIPAEMTLAEGETFTLNGEAEVFDGGVLTYQWYKDYYAIEGATDATFVIDAVEASDAGLYNLVITNTSSVGEATYTTSFCTLAVEEATVPAVEPVIDVDLDAAIEITEGEEATLTVEASTTDEGVLSYAWYKDDVAVEGANDASLTVTEAGAYYVVVTNTLGDTTATAVSATCTVTVKEPAPAGFVVAGSLTKSGSTDAATIELIADGEVVATTTIGGKTGDYAFENVAAGSYTLKVTKSKHAAREYAIVVADADVEQNVEVWLYGDVTADGLINNSDVMQINRRSTNQASMFDQTANQDYRLIVANVTAITGTDKLINNADVMQINRKNTNQASVFDRLA